VACAGHSILVGPAHNARELLEVEDRGRGGELPPDRGRPPRIFGGPPDEKPAYDHFVEEEQPAGARGERTEAGPEGPGPQSGRQSRRRGGASRPCRSSASG